MLDRAGGVIVSGASALTEVHGNYTSVTHINGPSVLTGGHGLQFLQTNIAASAMHNSKGRYADAPRCHKDTRKAVLKDITNWVLDDSKDTLILWLSAPAGSGKSAILQTIAETFHDSKGLAASFFFARTAPQRDTETHLIATIAAQLAKSVPVTKPFIEQVVLDDLSIFEKALPVQMELLVVQPLIQASFQAEWNYPWPSLLIIDGLDECNDGKVQADILHMFNDALLKIKYSLPRLYLLIASREEPAVSDVFEDRLSTITHHIVLDGSYDPDHDIATFLRSSFSDIYHRRRIRFPSMSSLPQPWPSEKVISFLVQKSSSQFIFAATVIRFVDEERKVPSAQLELILDICESLDASQHITNPFVLIDQLYTHVLRSTLEIKKVISFLGAIFCLQRNQAPTPALLESLFGLKSEEMVTLFWDLHSLIYLPACRTHSIHFYHASFRDYLVDRHRSEDLHTDEHAAHSLLLESCMRQLSKIPNSKRRRVNNNPALKYSTKAWFSHYSRGNSIKAGSMDGLLETFKPNSHCFSLSDSTTLKKLVYWWEIYGTLRSDLHDKCNLKKCSPICSGLNSALDQHLLSWLGGFSWTKSVVALLWLSLSFGTWESRMWRPTGHFTLLTEIGWLWDFTDQHLDDFRHGDKFLQLLQSFLQDPKRCRHLSVGKADSIGHFAHLCAQTVLNESLSSPANAENQGTIFYLHNILLSILLWGNPFEGGNSQHQSSNIDNFFVGKLEHIKVRAGIPLRGTCCWKSRIWQSSHCSATLKPLRR